MLKAFARTNEIITTLMLNYVAGLLLTYLIFDSASPWRDMSTIQTRSFPQSVAAAAEPVLADRDASFGVVVPFGFLLALGVAIALCACSSARTRFGFEMNVIGDSPRAARYAGMRTRRKILAVMGALRRDRRARRRQPGRRLLARPRREPAGAPGRELRLHGHRRRRARAATTRSPSVLVGVLIGGLQNAGLFLQGADFPSGLVGVMQGIILFCTLGGELLDPLPRADRPRGAPATAEPRRSRAVSRATTRSSSSCSRRRSSTGRRSCSPRSASCSPSGPACSTSASRG